MKLLASHGRTIPFNPWIGCTKVSPGCDNCVAPSTMILHSDMIWRPIGDANPGDEICGFDEFAPFGGQRKLRKAVIEKVWWSKRETRRIITRLGDLFATDDHRWRRKKSRHWVPTKRLSRGVKLCSIGITAPWEVDEDYRIGYLTGITTGDGAYRYIPGQRSDKFGFSQPYWRIALTDEEPLGRVVKYLATFGISANIRPFSTANMLKVELRALGPLDIISNVLSRECGTDNYKRGWIAGFFDAEGEHNQNVRVSQAGPVPLLQFQDYAARLGMAFDYEPWDGRVDTLRLVGELPDKIKFFSECRPAITRKYDDVFDRQCFTRPEPIEAVENHKPMDVIDIQTSTRTFFANGMATHNCYAEAQDHRWKNDRWGKGKPRTITSDANWKQPLKWHREAEQAGKKAKVFCGSLCDVMDDEAPVGGRERLWELIDKTPMLTWQLLTKRPHRYHRFLPEFRYGNVWLGTSAENQQFYDVRWPILNRLADRCAALFVSYEPALGPISIMSEKCRVPTPTGAWFISAPNWIIFGGESGSNRRPMERKWADDLLAECRHTGTNFFMKQMGARTPEQGAQLIPVELLIRQFPA